MAMLARVTGGAPVGSHRPHPTVMCFQRDRAQVAAAAAAQSARSEWAQFALEHGMEQMVYVGMNVLDPPSDESLPIIVFLLPEGLLRDAWPLLQSRLCSPLVGRVDPL